MPKAQYWTVEKGIVKPIKLPGIDHGSGDGDYPEQTKAKIKTKSKTK